MNLNLKVEKKKSQEAITGHTYLENSPVVNFWLTINLTCIQLATLRHWTNNCFINSLSFHLKKPGTSLIWNAVKRHRFCEIVQKCNSFLPTTASTLTPRHFCSMKAHWVCTINFIHCKHVLWPSGLANPNNYRSLGQSCKWNVPPRCEMTNGKWPSASVLELQ